MRDRSGKPVKEERIWALLDLFFDREMHRQNVVPGAVEALRAIGECADIVILTNIGNDYQANRVAQLEAFDIRHRVLCNRGGKGRPVLELIKEMRPGEVPLRRRPRRPPRIGGEPCPPGLAAAHGRRAAPRRG